jgi:hypothetical protein
MKAAIRWMQIDPPDLLEGELRLDHRKLRRADINVQRAVEIEIAVQIESARLEKRTLSVQRAVGIVTRRSQGDAVAACKHAGEQDQVGRHEGIILR